MSCARRHFVSRETRVIFTLCLKKMSAPKNKKSTAVPCRKRALPPLKKLEQRP